MNNRLFVGGLSWNTTDDMLRSAFEACCAVEEATVVVERDTGRSRGFGFVTLSDPAAVGLAIEKMDGSLLDGRSLRVDRAQGRRTTPRSH